MPKEKFLTRIENSENPLLFDGAMGTVLHTKGVEFDSCFDELNLTNPSLISEIHQGYINAGAEILLTNTFSANQFKLAEYGLEDQLEAINCAGVNLAKKVVEASYKEVYIAGDVGPLGVRLAPFGRVQPEQAREAFREQIKYLVSCGVDLIFIETISDLYEIQEAILAARKESDLPVVASMTFTRDDHTLLGDTAEKVATAIHEAGADVIGINCSGGPAQLLRILKKMQTVVPDGRFSIKPNAGWPEQVGGRIMYPAGPDYFGEYALAFRHAGAKLVGGCCGTTARHTAAMRTALDTTAPADYKNGFSIRVVESSSTEQTPVKTSELADKFSAGKFAIAVEMDPPRGTSTHKLQAGAGLLADAGADVINVADSPMARMRMSPWGVSELVHRKVNIETTLHFPTRGRNLLRIQGDLLAAHAIGIRNVFVVMGDPTEIGDYPEAMDNYDIVPT
ncbi:MAG: bifunctional homocysteine S-methyltransferase/methylenetetrahydrofolate reductase, partial [Chloroflexota bacterium]